MWGGEVRYQVAVFLAIEQNGQFAQNSPRNVLVLSGFTKGNMKFGTEREFNFDYNRIKFRRLYKNGKEHDASSCSRSLNGPDAV